MSLTSKSGSANTPSALGSHDKPTPANPAIGSGGGGGWSKQSPPQQGGRGGGKGGVHRDTWASLNALEKELPVPPKGNESTESVNVLPIQRNGEMKEIELTRHHGGYAL